VILAGSTSGSVDDTASVVLNDWGATVEDDGDGSSAHSRSESVIVLGVDSPDLGSSDLASSSVVSAAESLSLVGIATFVLERVALRVGKGISHPATVATSILQVAIDKLLLGERDGSSGSDVMVSFHGSSG